MTKCVARLVEVEVVQDDMVGYDLPFPVENLYGKRAFTETVAWGEIWFADPRSGMWWSGYVQDGKVYLDQSAREKFLHNRKHERQVPTRMLTGKYKVWLDAWVRRGDYVYADDAPFTNNPVHGDGGPWKAPKLPASKFWQEVTLAPAANGKPCRIRVRSRRFHWLYRLSRLLDLLEQLLLEHERAVEKVDELGASAKYIKELLAVLNETRTNELLIMEDKKRLAAFQGMNRVVDNVSIHCSNFIRYGVCNADDENTPTPLRRHINNVAHLIWRLIHEKDYAREMKLFEPVLAEEHRMLVTAPGKIFNRVPRVFTSVVRRDQFKVEAQGESFAYGREFAATFTFPFYNAMLKEAGHGPAFPAKKAASTSDVLNVARRYTISMLNAASIFVVKEHLDFDKLATLIDKEASLWSAAGKSDDMVALTTRWVDKFTALGKDELAGKWSKIRKDYFADIKKGRPELTTMVDDVQKDLEKIRGEMEAKPQKILDRLKTTTRPAVYGVQSLEIALKWFAAVGAWNTFRDELKKSDGHVVVKGADAGVKALDFAGSTVQFLGVQKVLRATWLSKAKPEDAATKLRVVERIGKGLGAAADLGSAVIYAYGLFDHRKELEEQFLPEDACAAFTWSLVTGLGKAVVAVGSGGGVFKSVPVFAKLQAAGYLLQLAGEMGEEIATYGGREHKHFHDANALLCQRAQAANDEVSAQGWKSTFYDPDDAADMTRYMKEFAWLPLDPALFQERFKPTAEPSAA
jgi:hypothetical protein